tara:strand:- start:301 stop:549 length:249 start_codon:yes stop_codon:yes gene_type:complete
VLLPLVVAPITGAWIETICPVLPMFWSSVAPITGAWIETPNQLGMGIALDVAPITGAWIETIIFVGRRKPGCDEWVVAAALR